MRTRLSVYFSAVSVVYILIASCSGKRENPDLGLAALSQGRSAAVTSHAPAFSNADRLQYIKPGETFDLANIEGPAKFYIDGEDEPSIWGTGTEDYFLCAWGFNQNMTPYFGCPYKSMDSEEDLGVRFTLYRWHINDPVRFSKSLKFTIEHTGWMSADETETGKVDGHVEREDDMATVAFWYQSGQPKRFTTLPPYQERVLPEIDIIYEGKDLMKNLRHSPGKTELQSGYDWTGNGQILFMPSEIKAWLETDFYVEKEEARGLVIRMTHSYDYGIYRIFIDGVAIPNVPMTIDMDFNAPAENIKILDLYSKDLLVKDYYLGSTNLKKGKHTIRFESVGKNDNSSGNYLGFDSFRLRERWNKKRASLR